MSLLIVDDIIKEWNRIKDDTDCIRILNPLSPAYIITLTSLLNQWYIKSENISIIRDTITYLERCNFFKAISNDVPASCYTWNSKNLTEITLINKEPQYDKISEMVGKIIVKLKKLERNNVWDEYLSAVENTFTTIATESIDNLIEHSESDFSKNACMYMMQHYPSTNTLHLAVIDCWIGIEESMKKSKHFKKWADGKYYVWLALQQHYTSKAEWRWNWLFMCADIVKNTNSKMNIISRNISYQIIWQEEKFDYNCKEFPWTLVNVEFNIDGMENNMDWIKRLTRYNDIQDMEYSYYNNLWS